jgi:FkbM family methyltransferase
MLDMLRKVCKKYKSGGARSVLDAAARRFLQTSEQTAAFTSRQVPTWNPMFWTVQWLERRAEFVVVQVGAFVGPSRTDPLCDLFSRIMQSDRDMGNSKAIFVEPVPEHFNRLRKNYQGLACARFEPVAIAAEAGERDFYCLGVDPELHGYPAWLAQLGSLKESRMGTMWDQCEKHPDWKRFYLEHRKTFKVQCVTLADLMNRHEIADIDLLQIDAEGADEEILRSVDFQKVRPRFVNFERVLLPDKGKPCRRMLEDAGYFTMNWGADTFCVRMD